jgi:hypothetical protein
MSKIDTKVVAVVLLILGLVVGYYANSSLISGPKIRTLVDTTSVQENQIGELETTVEALETERDSIQSDYDELLSSYDQEIEERDTQIDTLETQLQSYSSLITEQEASILELNSMIDELEDNYSELEEAYNEVYNPKESKFEINDLEFELTILSDKYSDNVPIQGNVRIYYSDGSAFRGTYKLSLHKVYVAAGSISEDYDIRGATTYKWNNPFVLGAGSYKLSLSDVKNQEGETVVTNSELRENPIYIFMG